MCKYVLYCTYIHAVRDVSKLSWYCLFLFGQSADFRAAVTNKRETANHTECSLEIHVLVLNEGFQIQIDHVIQKRGTCVCICDTLMHICSGLWEIKQCRNGWRLSLKDAHQQHDTASKHHPYDWIGRKQQICMFLSSNTTRNR